MHPDLALHLMDDLFWTAFIVSAPVLGLTMFVGLVISILQVVTQVQEMSLTFVTQFATRLWAIMPSMF